MALTPMVLTARLVRKQNPEAKIVFIGPCTAKKLEALRRSVKSEVDFVLTFEELAGMMESKGIADQEGQQLVPINGNFSGTSLTKSSAS